MSSMSSGLIPPPAEKRKSAAASSHAEWPTGTVPRLVRHDAQLLYYFQMQRLPPPRCVDKISVPCAGPRAPRRFNLIARTSFNVLPDLKELTPSPVTAPRHLQQLGDAITVAPHSPNAVQSRIPWKA
jgi:hypothetical protein